MGIKIEDFLRCTALPKRYFDVSFDIAEKYKEETEAYVRLLKMIDGNEFKPENQKVVKEKMADILVEVKKNFDAVSNIFEKYENANPKEAQEELDAMMDCLKDDIFIASIDDWVYLPSDNGLVWTRMRITPRDKFYRVRGVEEKNSDIQNNPNELFHIPLSKKAFTNNERFSIAGFPSLYLSSMLPLAWQECGYPTKYYYSEFQYEKLCGATNRDKENELKFLALYSPDEIYMWGSTVKYNNFNLWLEVILRYIKQYPLILACSFVNHSGKVSYKQEYIVPQMLMQWVQRNCDKVQGISYFTCVDISMFPSQWCAYNVVIPAQAPYDDKKYSIKLKEDFCWSKPNYFEIPIIDAVANKDDRESLYIFIGKIKEVLRTLYMPTSYRDYLTDILDVCVCLYNMLLRGKSMDMQLMIHCMNLLNRYYGKVIKQSAKDVIQNVAKDKLSEIELLDFDKATLEFESIVEDFTKGDRTGKSIYAIIEKYRNTIWNDFHCGSVITVLYSETDKIDEAISWLHDNHLIHWKRKLKPDDSTVNYIKDICKEIGISVDELWGKHVEDDEYMKAHMQEIKSPIFVRANDISIYSPVGTKMYDYLQIGFDKSELSKNLL